jgi:hypothetical protein
MECHIIMLKLIKVGCLKKKKKSHKTPLTRGRDKTMKNGFVKNFVYYLSFSFLLTDNSNTKTLKKKIICFHVYIISKHNFEQKKKTEKHYQNELTSIVTCGFSISR